VLDSRPLRRKAKKSQVMAGQIGVLLSVALEGCGPWHKPRDAENQRRVARRRRVIHGERAAVEKTTMGVFYALLGKYFRLRHGIPR
jgi:hypothetical protein